MLPRTRRCLLAFGCVAALAGCAEFPLYSEARDKQGQAAKSAWTEVDLKGQVTVARENLATLLARELTTADKLGAARRERIARSMALGGSIKDELVDPTARALTGLAGSPAQAGAWVAARGAQDLAERAVASAAQEMADAGIEMPSCEEVNAGKAEAMQPVQEFIASGGPDGQAVAQALGFARTACADPNLHATETVAVGRAILATRDQVRNAATALESARAATRNQRNAYKAALAAHQKALHELKTDLSAQETVKSAADKVKRAVAALDKASDVFSEKFLSEQRTESLNRLLSAVAETKTGEPPPEGASRAAVALVLLPELADNTRASLAEAKTATLVPLVLQKTREKIQLDAATRDVAAWEAMVDNRRQKLALQTKQAARYLNAARGFEAIDKRFQSMTLAAAFAQGSGERASLLDNQITLLRAVGLYLDAEGRLRSEIRKTDARATSMAHERALAYAEANAAQWDALISSGVDQLAAYGASGVKPEKIISILNSLTLLWIGSGVN